MRTTLPERASVANASFTFFVCYLAAAAVSLSFPSPIQPLSPMWLPSGVALVTVLLTGKRILPVVFLVSATTSIGWLVWSNNLTPTSTIASLSIAIGTIVEVSIARAIIVRLESNRKALPELIDRQAAYGFIVAIAIASSISATIGIATIVWAGGLHGADAAYGWLLWWGGNSIGTLTVCVIALPWVAPLFAGNSLWKGRRLSLDISMGLLVTALLATFVYSWQSEKNVLQNRIAERGNAVQDSLQRTFDAYFDTLIGLESYFQSSKFVDRQEFTQFTDNYINRLPGLRGIAWAPRSTAADIQELVINAEKDGITDYQLRSYKDKQAIQAPGEEHFPLFYASPAAVGKQVLGFDLLTNPNRAFALRASILSGKPTATVPITLIDDNGEIPGLLVINAILPAGAALGTPPMGAGMLAMQIGKVVDSSLREINFFGLELQIIDTSTGRKLLAYNDQHQISYDNEPSATQQLGLLKWKYDFPLAGQNWQLQLHEQPGFAASQRSWDNYLIPILGFLLSAIVAVFQLVSSGYTARVERMVKARTTQLSETNDELRDVAEQRKQAHDKLEQQARELKRSNEELQQFAYIASHDLQEPLRSINGFAMLLKNRYGDKLDQAGNEYINFVSEGSERMRQIIVDLLTYSRAGSKQLQPTTVNIDDVLESVKSNLSASIEESNAVITIETMPTLTADAQQMTLLFQNLIGNAIKYRSLTDQPKITIAAKRQTTSWEFSVADNGIGIKPEHQAQIFEIFKRLHSTVYYKGTGIGLAVCKRVVERHGGELCVESEENEGCTFLFTLPDELPADSTILG